MSPRLESEVAQWPGAKIVGVEQGRKHKRLHLSYGGQQRFIILPTTSSCRRAEQNQVRDVRKVLAELGAVRNERRKAIQRRQRNRPDRNPIAHVPLAPVKDDPWAALKAIEFAPQPPPKVSLLQRFIRWISARQT